MKKILTLLILASCITINVVEYQEKAKPVIDNDPEWFWIPKQQWNFPELPSETLFIPNVPYDTSFWLYMDTLNVIDTIKIDSSYFLK